LKKLSTIQINTDKPVIWGVIPGEKNMAIKIDKPTVIESAGNKPKIIEEFIGFVNSQTSDLSIAHMKSPTGWVEPGQKPEFTEYTVVLKGMLRVKTAEEQLEIHAGEAIIVKANEWVQYSTPDDEGAEYIAVCLPAFSPDTVHRDEV
jgi:mannose-6-phosphate isomerase-like protein (cupin superfamily)